MGKSKSSTRVEPRFDAPEGRGRTSALSLTPEDRVLPSSGSKKRRKASRKSANPRRKRRGLLRGLVYWSLVLCLWAGIIGVGIIAYYGAQLPSASTWAIPDRPPNVKILAVDGSLLANRGATGGEALTLREMSPYIPRAVIAIEDRRFYSHWGVDPIGLARAAFRNLVSGDVSQGGSTITQQLVKNLYLQPDRTIKRKVQEALLALWIERKYTKDQILEMYLNRVYFGSGAYGVEAAARRYFGKSARDVSLAEAALLAGLLKAPSRLSPARDPQAAEARAQIVLTAMREQGMINDSQLAAAMSAPAARAAAYWTGSEHYVADRVMEELPGLIGPIERDVVVETTIDLHLQKVAERSIQKAIDEKGKAMAVSQAALVSIDRAGAVRAMVGGYDYAHSQFDRASEAKRQPGSAFKPFVYMAALEQGRTPMSMRNDAPVQIGKWKPSNFQQKYLGQITLAEALARSSNSVAAQLTMEVGPKSVIEVASRMGIESKLRADASIALGTSEVTLLELTAAYVPFANGGYRPDIYFIERVLDTSGKVLYQRRDTSPPRVASAEIIGMMNYMLAGTISYGSGRSAAIDWPAAGKTGTTQESRDAWFVGYTANLVTGVWVGNDDSKPTKATGSSLPAGIWKDFMSEAHRGLKPRPLPGDWQPTPEIARSPSYPAQGYPDAPGDPTAAGRPAQTVPQEEHRGPLSIIEAILGH